MSELTVEEFKEHFETDLQTTAIQRLIDDAEVEVVAVAGDSADKTEIIESNDKMMYPLHKVSVVDSITENIDISPVLLSADDYRIRYGGLALERLGTGTNPAQTFTGVSSLVYSVGASSSSSRKRATIDMVKLAIQFDGLDSETSGAYSRSMSNYTEQRKNLAASACVDQRLAV